MKKKNLFDLLALKETVNSNKYLQKLTPLKEEKLKVLKILDQLTELKENKNLKKSLSAWELKSSSNIQEKIFDQISLAKSRINQVNDEILLLEKISRKADLIPLIAVADKISELAISFSFFRYSIRFSSFNSFSSLNLLEN